MIRWAPSSTGDGGPIPGGTSGFYGAEQSLIHHRRFGDLAETAAARLVDALRSAGHDGGRVIDLGCGSGILARELNQAGYHVTGVDISADMVALARRTAPMASFEVGSLVEVDLPPCVGVTAIGEALNYATDARMGPEQFATIVDRVGAALAPGGTFLFDVAGPGRHDGAAVRVHDHDDWLLTMRAEEDPARTTLNRTITIFTRQETGGWQRVDEHHRLCLYDPEWVGSLLEAGGFATVEQLEGYQPEGGSASPSTPARGWAVFSAQA